MIDSHVNTRRPDMPEWAPVIEAANLEFNLELSQIEMLHMETMLNDAFPYCDEFEDYWRRTVGVVFIAMGKIIPHDVIVKVAERLEQASDYIVFGIEPEDHDTGFKIELLGFGELSAEDRASGLSGNGRGAECAQYIKITHNGKTLRLESDAMEPEDALFCRNLDWIVAAIREAYHCGFSDGRSS